MKLAYKVSLKSLHGSIVVGKALLKAEKVDITTCNHV